MRTGTWKTLGLTGALIGTMAGCGMKQANRRHRRWRRRCEPRTPGGVVEEEVRDASPRRS